MTMNEMAEEIERLREECQRYRMALQREYERLQSLGRNMTHYDGCNKSQGHAICYAMKQIADILHPLPANGDGWDKLPTIHEFPAIIQGNAT